MKQFYFITVTLLGLPLGACDFPGVSTCPAYYNPGCHVDVYEGGGFGGPSPGRCIPAAIMIGDLGGMKAEIESIRVMDHAA